VLCAVWPRALLSVSACVYVCACVLAMTPLESNCDPPRSPPPPQQNKTPKTTTKPNQTKPNEKQKPPRGGGKDGKGGRGGKKKDEGGSPSFIQADLCINNAAAVYNTEMVAAYVRVDPRLRGLVFLVKVGVGGCLGGWVFVFG
jgi:hypothetical protein